MTGGTYLNMHSVFVISVMIAYSSAQTSAGISAFEELTQSGTSFNINPVKVTSDEDQPLLMFYLVNSSLKPRIEVLMDTDFTIIYDYSVVCVSTDVSFLLTVSVSKDQNLEIIEKSEFIISCENATETVVSLHKLRQAWNKTDQSKPNDEFRTVYIADGQIDVKMRSGIIGYSDVIFSIQSVGNDTKDTTSHNEPITSSNSTSLVIHDPKSSYETLTYQVTIVRKMRPLDKLFRVVVYAVQIFVATGFGAKLDLKVVKENLFRPVAPGIGLTCQYLLMPLVNIIKLYVYKISDNLFILCIPLFLRGNNSNVRLLT
jgi:hypothetical protein